LAKADGEISADELTLHDRMAKLMNIAPEEVEEIRRLILLKSGINLPDRIKVIQGDITQQAVDSIAILPALSTSSREDFWFHNQLPRAANHAKAFIHSSSIKNRAMLIWYSEEMYC
jgi:hypothetical protein